MIDEASEIIAVEMLRRAYAHWPAATVAGAIAKADTGPMREMLTAVTLTAYSEGLAAGAKQGRRELEAEMEADWTPVAERVRARAGSPSREQLERLRDESIPEVEYLGGRMEKW